MVLGELDSQLLVPVDVRCAVVVTVDSDVAVGVELRRLPLPTVIHNARQALQSGSLDLLERSRRERESGGGLVVDSLTHTISARLIVDRGNRERRKRNRKNGKGFLPVLCDCFIARPPHTSGNDSRAKMCC